MTINPQDSILIYSHSGRTYKTDKWEFFLICMLFPTLASTSSCHQNGHAPTEHEMINAIADGALADQGEQWQLDQNGFFTILVLDPKDIHMCGGLLVDWTSRLGNTDLPASIFLTREPTTTELRHLRRYRIEAKVLSIMDSELETIHSPMELIITPNRIMYWKLGTSPNVRSSAISYMDASSSTETVSALSADPQIVSRIYHTSGR